MSTGDLKRAMVDVATANIRFEKAHAEMSRARIEVGDAEAEMHDARRRLEKAIDADIDVLARDIASERLAAAPV